MCERWLPNKLAAWAAGSDEIDALLNHVGLRFGHADPGPARIPHSWSNQSDKPFRVLVVKVPCPTEATKLL